MAKDWQRPSADSNVTRWRKAMRPWPALSSNSAAPIRDIPAWVAGFGSAEVGRSGRSAATASASASLATETLMGCFIAICRRQWNRGNFLFQRLERERAPPGCALARRTAHLPGWINSGLEPLHQRTGQDNQTEMVGQFGSCGVMRRFVHAAIVSQAGGPEQEPVSESRPSWPGLAASEVREQGQRCRYQPRKASRNRPK